VKLQYFSWLSVHRGFTQDCSGVRSSQGRGD
jgi:hypothetical protein